MTIRLNGEPHETGAPDLAALLAELALADSVVATARNGEFVGRSERAATALQPGDAIEIVAPMQGG